MVGCDDHCGTLRNYPLSAAVKNLVCLACTELPLAFPEYQDSPCFTIEGITVINTTVAHVEAILETALA